MPTRVAIENQFEPVRDLPFPAVALCSPNQITVSSMEHFNKTLVDGNRTVELRFVLPQLLGFYAVVKSDEASLAQLQSLIELNRYTILEVMSSLPQTCDQFLKLCIWRRRRYPRCAGLFRPILTKHGLCCIFNSVYRFENNRRNERDPHFTHQKVMQGGVSQGLTVVTDFEPDDAVDATVVSSGSTRLMFTDWSEFPTDDESSLIQPHTESFHSIHATYTYCSPDVKDLAVESRNCYFKDEQVLPFFREYHNSDCDLLCLVAAVERRCRCQLHYVPHVTVQAACTVSHIACINEVKTGMSKRMVSEKCNCPRDCEERRYRVERLMGNLLGLPHLMMNPYAGIVFNESTSIMHIFFPKSVYVKKKQETVMSITTLVANLGGVFGLCIGCSVISVCELLYFVHVAIRNYVREKMRPTGRPRVDAQRVAYLE